MFGAGRPALWTIKHVVGPLHRWIYRRTGGRVLGRNVLLLTTRGRKSGALHTIPVFFLDDAGTFVVCNVRPGSERTNPWVLNLRADPVATVQTGRDRIVCDARELDDPQADHYWPRLVALWPAYREHYEHSGERSVFVLRPRN